MIVQTETFYFLNRQREYMYKIFQTRFTSPCLASSAVEVCRPPLLIGTTNLNLTFGLFSLVNLLHC